MLQCFPLVVKLSRIPLHADRFFFWSLGILVDTVFPEQHHWSVFSCKFFWPHLHATCSFNHTGSPYFSVLGSGIISLLCALGSGKTTLLDLLAGRRGGDLYQVATHHGNTNEWLTYRSVHTNTQGEIFVNGIPINPVRDWYIANTGYVLQLATPYYQELTVRENLTLAAQMRLPSTSTWEERFERVERIIREVTTTLYCSGYKCKISFLIFIGTVILYPNAKVSVIITQATSRGKHFRDKHIEPVYLAMHVWTIVTLSCHTLYVCDTTDWPEFSCRNNCWRNHGNWSQWRAGNAAMRICNTTLGSWGG